MSANSYTMLQTHMSLHKAGIQEIISVKSPKLMAGNYYEKSDKRLQLSLSDLFYLPGCGLLNGPSGVCVTPNNINTKPQ